MSPTLFNVLMACLSYLLLRACSDSLSHIPSLSGIPIPLLMFADDLDLLALDFPTLQTLLTQLQVICLALGLTINPKKTRW